LVGESDGIHEEEVVVLEEDNVTGKVNDVDSSLLVIGGGVMDEEEGEGLTVIEGPTLPFDSSLLVIGGGVMDEEEGEGLTVIEGPTLPLLPALSSKMLLVSLLISWPSLLVVEVVEVVEVEPSVEAGPKSP
jgi:hypothetical protein